MRRLIYISVLCLFTALPKCATEEPSPSPTSEASPEGTLVAHSTCGDGILNTEEVCDLTNLDFQTCQSLGFFWGNLSCAEDCLSLNTDECVRSRGSCGDDIVTGNETCDGSNVGSVTCEQLGYRSGVLRCNGTCDGYNFGDCVPASTSECGNLSIEPGEVCDSENVGDLTCSDFGFTEGALLCDSSCSAYDTTACTNYETSTPTCGDGLLDNGEVCDSSNLNGATCHHFGFDAGDLACNTTCTDFVTSACAYAPQGCAPQCQDSHVGDGTCQAPCNTPTCNYDQGDCTPPLWSCPPESYGIDEDCDCGCGAPDPDCPDHLASSCDTDSCPPTETPGTADNSQCITSPLGDCAPGCRGESLGDGSCDWSCNIPSCDFDHGDCDSTPDEWTCLSDYFDNEDGCDCGCGVLDPDCLSNEGIECNYSHCPADTYPDPTDNTHCIPA